MSIVYQLFQNKPDRTNLLLSKDYWMKDDSAKECFSCGKPFTTFRRRHHCRVCGQIFCDNCTTMVPGDKFNYTGKIRLCNSCLSYEYANDSSDEDEDYDYEDDDDNDYNNLLFHDSEQINDEEDTSSSNIYSTNNNNSSHAIMSNLFDDIHSISKSLIQDLGEGIASDNDVLMDSSNLDDFNLPQRRRAESNLRSSRSISRKNPNTSIRHIKSGIKRSRSMKRNINEADMLDTSYRSSFHDSNIQQRPRSKSFDPYTPGFRESIRESLLKDIDNKAYMMDQLSKLNLRYLDKFLKQILVQFNIKKKKLWYNTIKRLLLSINDLDISSKISDESFDITRYIKIKRILGADPKDSRCIHGLIFTKNVGLRSMRTLINKPHVMLILFPLEYAKGAEIFISMDQMIAQEKEYLNKLVKRIVLLSPKPDVIITSSSISGYALEYFDKAGISVAYNVKQTLLQKLSRLLDADIVFSMEKLATKPKLGSCETFEVRTYAQDNIKKTLMGFTGCNKFLGSTIVIRGGNEEVSRNIKGILEFMIYMLFHLKLETHYFEKNKIRNPKKSVLKWLDNRKVPEGYYSQLVENFLRTMISISPTVIIPLPNALEKARYYESRLKDLGKLYFSNGDINSGSIEIDTSSAKKLVKDRGIHLSNGMDNDSIVNNICKEIISFEIKKLQAKFRRYSKRWEFDMLKNFGAFTAISFHQNIYCLFLTANMDKKIHCNLPKPSLFEYYRDESDLCFGKYIQNLIHTAHDLCPYEKCGSELIDHGRIYAHGDGKVTFFIEECSSKLQNNTTNDILTWSTCRKCAHTLETTYLDEFVWEMSFGKVLEIYFLSVPLKTDFERCSHEFNDRIQYFGYQDLAVRLEFERITVLELITPSRQVASAPSIDANLKLTVYENIINKVNSFFESVVARLQGVKVDGSNTELGERRIEELLLTAHSDHRDITNKVNELYKGTSPTEYLPLNIIIKDLQNKSVEWDLWFNTFEEEFSPSENDITRITAFQLKSFFKEKKPQIGDEKKQLEKKSFAEKDNDVHNSKCKEDNVDYSSDSDSDAEFTLQNEKQQHLERTEAPKSKMLNENGYASNKEIKSFDEGTGGDTEDIHSNENKDLICTDKNDTVSNENFLIEEPNPSVLERVSKMEARMENVKQMSTETLLKKELTKKSGLDDNNKNTHNMALSKTIGAHSQDKIQQKQASQDSQANIDTSKKTKVSALKEYYDRMHANLKEEFVLQRENERKMIANRYKANPLMSSKPIVEVYQDVEDAVLGESEANDENDLKSKSKIGNDNTVKKKQLGSNADMENENAKQFKSGTRKSNFDIVIDETDLNTSKEGENKLNQLKNISPADVDEDSTKSMIKIRKSNTASSNSTLLAGVGNSSPSIPLRRDVEIPEKNSLLSAIRKFWADRSVLWKPLAYPLKETEHIFVDSDVIIREDEPGSLISFFMSSDTYIQTIKTLRKDLSDQINLKSQNSDIILEAEMLRNTARHLNFYIMDGQAYLGCKIFYSGQFEALREACGETFIQSLSRCVKWDSQGGKSGSAFLKTFDNKLIIKQLSESEFDSFIKMAPNYFHFMSKTFFHNVKTCISKIFGFFQVVVKNPTTGKNYKMNIIVMENLFYNRENLTIFDLKGSIRNRHVEQTGNQNQVLLDVNMLDYIFESPLFVNLNDKRLLKGSLLSDTRFLNELNIMDYSLVIGIDHVKKELVAGIIDYVRTYTWDKKLETWVKEKGLVGGTGGREPTVVTPDRYRSRFINAMEKYIPFVPDKYYTPE